MDKGSGPPVLYLRSFAFDVISAGPRALHHRLPFALGFFGAEELLVQILQKYAPVLAIGRPGEGAPPFGATRFYIDNAVWQHIVGSLVPLSRLVIWASGNTDGLLWEITHLVGNIEPRRLLLMVHVHVMNLTPDQRALEWTTFLARSSHVFPKPLPQSVEGIRFLVFDDAWKPTPVPASDYRPTAWELITYRPGCYGLEPVLREKLL